MKRNLSYLLVLISLLSACASSSSTAPEPIITKPTTSESTTPEESMSLQLTSDAFTNGQSIPAKYTCIGKSISPALAWNEPPADTLSSALIVVDPNAPGETWA